MLLARVFLFEMFWSFSVSFFFFKQKTAYEMRISDWSSDVCSSDLNQRFERRLHQRVVVGLDRDPHHRLCPGRAQERAPAPGNTGLRRRQRGFHAVGLGRPGTVGTAHIDRRLRHLLQPTQRLAQRSEEHTSELQSLMRISYAAFCLKKKYDITNNKK